MSFSALFSMDRHKESDPLNIIIDFSSLCLMMLLVYEKNRTWNVWQRVSGHREDQRCDSLVTATWRLAFPSSITSITSSGLVTKRSVQPLVRKKHMHPLVCALKTCNTQKQNTFYLKPKAHTCLHVFICTQKRLGTFHVRTWTYKCAFSLLVLR